MPLTATVGFLPNFSAPKHIFLSGIGKFEPAAGGPVAHLGLACTLPVDIIDVVAGSDGVTVPPFPCEGGIAQNFPALHASLASLTPLTLTVTSAGDHIYGVAFAGKNSRMMTGPAGSLNITTPTNQTLGIGGPATYYGAAKTTGSTAAYALFPPPPTGWSITDKLHNIQFAIAVQDADTRNSIGKVTRISTGAVLATIAVDQSGTGTIDYADGTEVAVTGWVLGG